MVAACGRWSYVNVYVRPRCSADTQQNRAGSGSIASARSVTVCPTSARSAAACSIAARCAAASGAGCLRLGRLRLALDGRLRQALGEDLHGKGGQIERGSYWPVPVPNLTRRNDRAVRVYVASVLLHARSTERAPQRRAMARLGVCYGSQLRACA